MEKIKNNLRSILNATILINTIGSIIFIFFGLILCSYQNNLYNSNTTLVTWLIIIIFFFTKLIVNLFWCNVSFMKPERRLPESRFLVLINQLNLNPTLKDLLSTRIGDYVIMLLPFVILSLIIICNLFIAVLSGNVADMDKYYLLVVLSSILLTSVRHILRLDNEYAMNFKDAKSIFMRCKGNLNVLYIKNTYTRYQVPKRLELEWQSELNNKSIR